MISQDAKRFISFIQSKRGTGNKSAMIAAVQDKFKLAKDRSVYHSDHFAVRFSYSASAAFSNTIISLSNLKKYDSRPFFVCLITPTENIVYIANSTFIKKVSHSSQLLRINNIRGSINGSDIAKEFEGIKNIPKNFAKLFNIHAKLGFDGNLARLVEATTNISPSGKKFKLTPSARKIIGSAPERALGFSRSEECARLKKELDDRVKKYEKEILIAETIENVNIRGRIIEYLITGDDEKIRISLVKALHGRKKSLPKFKTKNGLADYVRTFDRYRIAIDIKTKMMSLSSNPKGYNIDKLLEFLSTEKSVFIFYFIGLQPNNIANTALIPVFQTELLKATILIKHWSGRNSRGVSQFEGETLAKLISAPRDNIDILKSIKFLDTLTSL